MVCALRDARKRGSMALTLALMINIFLVIALLVVSLILFLRNRTQACAIERLNGRIAEAEQAVVDATDALSNARQTALERASAYLKREEKKIRKDAVKRSTAVVKGKVAEQYALYDLPYNPRDARFLGSPTDFVVFVGLTEGEVHKIVFLEIKTGKTGRLSKRERQVEKTVWRGDVEYEHHHIREE